MSDEDAPGLFERLPWFTVPAVLLGLPLIVALLALISPEVFYDNLVWKYYWGPIKADAAPGTSTLFHNGVAADAGYNIVNTISWAGLLGICLVGLTQMMQGLKVRLNNTAILGATAWVVTGAIYHVLEDTDLMLPTLQYVFITPPIYLLFGAFGVASLLVGTYMERINSKAGVERALQKLWLLQSVILLVYTLAWAADWSKIVVYVNPLHVALFTVINHFAIRAWVHKKGLDARDLVWLATIMPLLVAFDYIWVYSTDPWTPYGGDGMVSAIFWAPALAGATAALVWGFGKWMTAKGKGWGSVFSMPINVVLVFSQMIDGFATALGIDIAHYSEKHVLSARVIDSFRNFAERIGWEYGAAHPTFFAFVPLKLLVSVLVIVAIDIYSKKDVEKYPTMIGFVKFAIIMVGIGPGVRDFVRLAMGV